MMTTLLEPRRIERRRAEVRRAARDDRRAQAEVRKRA
jgi:hypothetical protein